MIRFLPTWVLLYHRRRASRVQLPLVWNLLGYISSLETHIDPLNLDLRLWLPHFLHAAPGSPPLIASRGIGLANAGTLDKCCSGLL